MRKKGSLNAPVGQSSSVRVLAPGDTTEEQPGDDSASTFGLLQSGICNLKLSEAWNLAGHDRRMGRRRFSYQYQEPTASPSRAGSGMTMGGKYAHVTAIGAGRNHGRCLPEGSQ